MSSFYNGLPFKKGKSLVSLIRNFALIIIIISFHLKLIGQAPNLGIASDFALFTSAGAFNNTSATTLVTGDVGTNVGAFNAFPPGILNGDIHVANAVTAQADTDVMNAYSYLDGLACGMVLGTTLGNGQTLTPNIYCILAAATINGNLVLDAEGDPNAIFIIQIDGALSTNTLSSVTLINSASLCNVFWQINGAVSLGENSLFTGTMLIEGAINMAQGATLNGRGLSTAGAISLTENIVNIPDGSLPTASIITASGPVELCEGDSVTLSGNVGGIWNNGLTTPNINVLTEGDYYVINSNGCGRDTSNHIFVTIFRDTTPPVIICPPNLTLYIEPLICEIALTSFTATATDNCSEPNDIVITSDYVSGTLLAVGNYVVTFEATDVAGNISTCMATVAVLDTISPICSDLNNNITINLLPTRCDTAVTFTLPVGTDNCDPAPVSSVLVGQPASGDRFDAGTHTVEYLLTDASGNTTICSFDIIVNDYVNPSLGCIPVQLSLDEDCEGQLTPTSVLTGWTDATNPDAILLGCLDNYEINIVGPNGELLGDTADRSLLGKTLEYIITHTVNGFICDNTVTIEDKIAPTITCRDITVNCLDNIANLGLPVVTDNCNATAVLVNEVHALLQCDPLYAGTVTRSWKAVDDFGNESAVCTSVVYIERSDLTGVTGPASDTLVCNSGFATDDRGFGYPAPSVTGVPTYLGSPIFPLSLFNMTFCNATIDYTDQLVINTVCKRRILRTWTITEWWCSTAITYNMPPQFIDIIDNVAPVIPQLDDITVTTQTRSCDAAVQLPVLNITDNCTQVYNVYINARLNGNAAGFLQGNGGLITLGVGVNEITYTAIDECGNTTKMTYNVTVRDNTDPVAICDQHTTVSIKTNGYTEVTATAVDDGSFDECGAVTLQIRRMEDPCDFGADTAWFDKVGYCCADANTTRMVQLLVTDAGGNTNICMVSVQVQDKVDPTIECPLDMTIDDCLFTFDPSPAGADAAFGEAIITDNCPANNIIRQTLEDNRNQCGIGTVERTISVIGDGITYGTCTQTITFENNEPFLGSSIIWPKDYTALGQCNFDGLEPETLPDSSSVPLFTEDACDLIGMRHDDLVFPFTTNGACYKIIRTWTVIDWCQKNRDGSNVTWTYEQEIKVIDNDAPTLTVSDTTVIFETLACSTGLVTLSASAIDCTPAADLVWNYTITQGASVIATGTTNTVVDSFEVGEYTISFTVEDRCGNLSADSYDFEVVTLKAPTATCHFGLSAPLVLMDTDGNGSGDTPMLMLSPSFFDKKSSHTCGYELSLSFSADLNDTLIVFDCDDLGEQDIQLWVTDENGNTSFCATYVIVQDNGDFCTKCCGDAKIYGDANSNKPERIKVINGSTFIAGTVEINNEIYATITRFDGNDLLWEYRFSVPSLIHDFVETGDVHNSLLLVGETLPLEQFGTQINNKSIFAKIGFDGSPEFVRTYDRIGREFMFNIIKHPYASNSAFPYYIVGQENPLSNNPSRNDVVNVHNINSNGEFNWTKRYEYEDDEWGKTLVPLQNGDMMLLGTYTTIYNTNNPPFRGVMVVINGQNGNVVHHKRTTEEATFWDAVQLDNGQIVVTGVKGNTSSGVPQTSPIYPIYNLLDENYNIINTVSFPVTERRNISDQFRSQEIKKKGPNSIIGTLLSGNGNRLIFEGEVVANNFVSSRTRKLNIPISSNISPRIDLLDNNLIYSLSVLNQNGGFGSEDIVFGSLPLDEEIECLVDTLYSFVNNTIAFEDFVLNESTYDLAGPENNTNLVQLNYEFTDVCDLPSNIRPIISGKTIKENNEVIQDVTLELKGGEANPVNTNYDGNYAFTPMNTGGDYQVIPNKDGDDANGISTLDLVLIQRHILGIEKLKSPYKLIAADANNSGKITAADLIDIRKLILGVNASFPNNTSWRFVDAGFVFPDPTDPWMSAFDEKYNINNLSGDMNIDFIGVKIGDVNDNAKGRNISGGDITTRSNQVYNIADRQVSRGEIIEIPVMANTVHTIYGIQMSLASNDVIIRDIKEGVLQITSDDYVLDGSDVAMSVAVANGKSVSEGDVLFTIEVEVLRSGKLSDFLQLSNKVRPEVYMNADIETKAFAIDFRTSSEGVFALVGNHPNPWNSNTTVTFEIPTDGMVSFKVKDYTGRKVVSQINQFNAGVNTIDLQKADLIQSGVYIYEIKFGDKVLHGKMIMID